MGSRYALLASAVLLAAVGAQAQRTLGQNTAAYDDITAADLYFRYNFPTNAAQLSALMQSNATSLNAAHANIVSRVFSLSACSSFLPHTHPGASEFFFQRDGTTTFNVLLNGALVRRTLLPFDTLLVPQNAIHFFFNDACTQSNIITSLNSATPGFQGFYEGPDVDKLRSTIFTASDLQMLAASGTQNATLDRARAFLQITNDCVSRCGLATAAPTPPSTYAPTTMAPTTPSAPTAPTAPTAAGLMLGQNIAAFNDISPAQLFYRYTQITDAAPRSALQQSNATSLNAAHANVVSRIFSIAPCSSFLPHTHPNAAEFFVGTDGTLLFSELLNGNLVQRNVTVGDSFLVAQGALHYFYNDQCTQANAVTALNSAAPGFNGFYDGPLVDKLRSTVFNASDLMALANSNTQNMTLDQSRAFLTITDDCMARCSGTMAPTGMAPTTMGPTAMTAPPTTMAPTPTRPTPTKPSPPTTVARTSCPAGQALRSGACQTCVSTKTDVGRATRGRTLCYKPETLSRKSTTCGSINLTTQIRSALNPRNAVRCINPKKSFVAIYLPIKSSKYSYISPGSYVKSSMRLAGSIVPRQNKGRVVSITRGFRGIRRLLITFTDKNGVLKKRSGQRVYLTGVIRREGRLLDICFQSALQVCG